MSGIRTPLNSTPAFALGNGKWLKEVLRAGDLHYQGGTYPISTDYLDSVVAAYDAKAIKRVPFQLAGPNNEHDQRPERRRGFIEGLRRNGDSLEAVIDLEDEANHIVETDTSFPVSVLINHDRTTGEGKHFDAVLTHVLGTYDSVLTDLGDWVRLPEEIAASNDGGGDVIDFLALNAAERADPLEPTDSATLDSSSDEGATPDPSERTEPMPTLAELLTNASDDDLKALRAKLDEVDPPKPAEGDDDEPTDDVATDESDDDTGDDSAPSDEEIEAMLTTSDDLETESPEQVAASHAAGESDNAIALANMSSQLEEMRLANEVTGKKLAEAEWKTEKDAWIHANIPPHILGLCEPFLNGASKTLALSNGGDKERVAGQLRKVLTEISKQAPNLGLSQGQIGTSEEADQAREEAEARAAKAAKVTAHLK